MTLGLSTSDINYLGECESNDFEDISTVDVVDVVNTNIITQSAVNSTADLSSDLQQKFSGLKIPSDTSQTENVQQPNIQQCGQGQILGMLDGPSMSELTQGLRVVSSITVPFSSSVSNTTSSYSTAPANSQQEVISTNADGMINVTSLPDGSFNPPVAHITSHTSVLGIPLQVASKTPDTPNVFVVSMTVDNNIEKKEDDDKIQFNPLETTITAIPEPQRASTPDVTDDCLQDVMDETIVAGFGLAMKKKTEVKEVCRDVCMADGNIITMPKEKSNEELKQKEILKFTDESVTRTSPAVDDALRRTCEGKGKEENTDVGTKKKQKQRILSLEDLKAKEKLEEMKHQHSTGRIKFIPTY